MFLLSTRYVLDMIKQYNFSSSLDRLSHKIYLAVGNTKNKQPA